MIVKRNKANITKIEGKFFYPGNNVINKEDEEKFTDNEYFQQLLETKINGIPIHEIVAEGEAKVVSSEKGEVYSDLAGMNAKNAIGVVKETYSIPALEKMAEEEDRSSVIKAIDKQISKIREE